MRQGAVTIQDIARMVGVSTATVSRALSHPERVSESTRELVLEAVRVTGYRINNTARNLRRKRTGSILALVPNLANPFFSQILSGLASVLTPLGYGLLIADTHTDPDPASRLGCYLDGRLADGLVIFDGSLMNKELMDRPRPPVVLACEWDGSALPSVTVDNAAGAAMAVHHLIDAGHRAIGHISGPDGNVLTESRLSGAREALAQRGLELPDEWIFRGDFSLASGARAGAEWLRLASRPTAVFCASDELACGFIGALQHAGTEVPRDVSVVGFDDIEVVEHLTPALTSIRQPRRLIGERAAELLIKMIEADTLVGPSVIIPVELIPRQSVAAPRRALSRAS